MARPVVGAIRWDAWVGETPETPGYDVGLQVERSLGPKEWHYRLPFFAKEISDTEVRVRGNNQAIMDQEIAYARAAGLDYWAFVMYAPHDPTTKGGLDLYLQSKHRGDIRFAMMVQSYTSSAEDIERLIRYFRMAEYQKVASGRPLVFMLGPSKKDDPSWPHAKAFVDELRAKTIAAGMATPYLVHDWGWDGANEVIGWLGLDAMSAYSLQYDDVAAPFATLAEKTERKWDEWRASSRHVVPLVMAGWDRRPRVTHPVSWEIPDKPGAIEHYYEAPSPAELEAHVRRSIEWCRRNPQTTDANAVLIYAWNEIDEGGWLVPSLWPEQGTKRLDALARALKSR